MGRQSMATAELTIAPPEGAVIDTEPTSLPEGAVLDAPQPQYPLNSGYGSIPKDYFEEGQTSRYMLDQAVKHDIPFSSVEKIFGRHPAEDATVPLFSPMTDTELSQATAKRDLSALRNQTYQKERRIQAMTEQILDDDKNWYNGSWQNLTNMLGYLKKPVSNLAGKAGAESFGEWWTASARAQEIKFQKSGALSLEGAGIVGSNVGEMALGFAATPTAKVKAVGLIPRIITGAGSAGIQFGLHEAIIQQNPEGAPMAAAMGVGIGAAGPVPRIIRAPSLAAIFGGATYAQGGTPDEVMRSVATVLGFEALGVVQEVVFARTPAARQEAITKLDTVVNKRWQELSQRAANGDKEAMAQVKATQEYDANLKKFQETGDLEALKALQKDAPPAYTYQQLMDVVTAPATTPQEARTREWAANQIQEGRYIDPTTIKEAVNGKEKAPQTLQVAEQGALAPSPTEATTGTSAAKAGGIPTTTAEMPIRSSGEVLESRVAQRARESIKEFAQTTANYNEMNIDADVARALRFLEERPAEAKKIAHGLAFGPDEVTTNSVAAAYAAQQMEAGNWAEAGKATVSRSLRLTRKGQEIASEKAWVNANSPIAFMKQVVNARMREAGKTLFGSSKKAAVKERVTARIKEETTKLKGKLTAKRVDISEAQKILDDLIC
jgi:hypothetical protein